MTAMTAPHRSASWPVHAALSAVQHGQALVDANREFHREAPPAFAKRELVLAARSREELQELVDRCAAAVPEPSHLTRAFAIAGRAHLGPPWLVRFAWIIGTAEGHLALAGAGPGLAHADHLAFARERVDEMRAHFDIVTTLARGLAPEPPAVRLVRVAPSARDDDTDLD